jgi:hypothetical protein
VEGVGVSFAAGGALDADAPRARGRGVICGIGEMASFSNGNFATRSTFGFFGARGIARSP